MLFSSKKSQLINKISLLLIVTISLITIQPSQANQNRGNNYLIAQSMNSALGRFETTRQQIQRIIPQPGNTKKIYALFIVLGTDDLDLNVIYTVYAGYNEDWEYEKAKWIQAIYTYQINIGIQNPNGIISPNSHTAIQLTKHVAEVRKKI